jgi:hypothetical protein
MSRDMTMPGAQVEVFSVQRRRRFSAEEKQRLVQETLQPGMTISLWLANIRSLRVCCFGGADFPVKVL